MIQNQMESLMKVMNIMENNVLIGMFLKGFISVKRGDIDFLW